MPIVYQWFRKAKTRDESNAIAKMLAEGLKPVGEGLGMQSPQWPELIWAILTNNLKVAQRTSEYLKMVGSDEVAKDAVKFYVKSLFALPGEPEPVEVLVVCPHGNIIIKMWDEHTDRHSEPYFKLEVGFSKQCIAILDVLLALLKATRDPEFLIRQIEGFFKDSPLAQTV